MSGALHHDDALRAVERATVDFVVAARKTVERAVVLDDLFGRLRVLFAVKSRPRKLDAALAALYAALAESAAPFWADEPPWVFDRSKEAADLSLFEEAWDQGVPVPIDDATHADVVRRSTRIRDHSGWFVSPSSPPWPVARSTRRAHTGPPIIAFLSFKGGVGRTTALASFAIQRARLGEHIVAVDLDLDAPGVGTLLDDDPPGTTATHGVVDLLLESPHLGDTLRVEEYVHRCRRIPVAGSGSIVVMPAGQLGPGYLSRLARVDLELQRDGGEAPMIDLLKVVRAVKPSPHWILLDGRAGLSEVAGVLTSGIAHLHVIFGTSSEQSFAGIERFVHRLGAERLTARGDLDQGDVIVVQTMVSARARGEAVPAFSDRVREIFVRNYMTERADEDDRFWSVEDVDNEEGPHVPSVIPYSEPLSYFGRIDEIADALARDPDHQALAERIAGRFPHAGKG